MWRGVWTFDTGLISVWGPRSERSKARHCCEIWGRTEERFSGVLRALSGFGDGERERERWRMNGERERERTDKTDKNRKKDREQTNKSAGRLNLCVFCVHAGVCECVSP